MTSRRDLLKTLGAAGVAMAALPGLSLGASGSGEQRLVFIFLRGAMDGLSAVPAYGDGNFAARRGRLAIPAPGQSGGALKLDGMFGLHPQMPHMHGLYSQGQMAVLHAIASPYRDRSHFDAQDLLENGTAKAHGRDIGWLNVAVGGLSTPSAVALGTSVPLIARGPNAVSSWSPSMLPSPTPDTLERLAQLYRGDALLEPALARAREANSMMAGRAMQGETQPTVVLAKAAATFLAKADGPRVATIDFGGWDSHTNQIGEYGVLTRNFAQLDRTIATLQTDLGALWAKTAVVIVTEFGRTVAPNGSGGTDHGTASVAFLLGGAVRGGRVIADWPGLTDRALYESRDLAPTTDLRALFKAVLIGHLQLSETLVESKVFPDSRTVRPLEGLFKS